MTLPIAAVSASRSPEPRNRDQATDEESYVVVDARGQQVNGLPTTMTVAEALEDSLGPRR